MYADDEAPGDSGDPDDPLHGLAAQTFVGRVRYDLYTESHIGAIFTDRELHDSHSRLAGFDSNFRLNDTHSVAFRAMRTAHRDLDGLETEGHLQNAELRMQGRHLRYNLSFYELSPGFRTDVGFVRRTDQRVVRFSGQYVRHPETWLQRWGPEWTYERNHDFSGVLQDEQAGGGLNFAFARNSFVATNYDRVLERYKGIDFYKKRFRVFARTDASRRIGLSFEYRRGDQIYFDPASPYLGYERGVSAFINLRPISRLKSEINIDTNRFSDPRRGGMDVFEVRIVRALTTWQFSNRLLARNISEYNTFDKTFDLNVLFTYRVNAGTVFYAGYDDHYQQADRIDWSVDRDELARRHYYAGGRRRTNRAIFLKVQYLFRY